MSEMSRDEAKRLPTTVGLVRAATAIGIGRSKAYQLAKKGTFPVPVRRVGNSYRVPTTPLLEYLGLDDDDDGTLVAA